MGDTLSNVSALPARGESVPAVTNGQARHTRGRLLAYGSAALPLCLAEIPIIVYLPAFYARELSLSAGLVGMVFLVARLWDGISDLLVGWLSDSSSSRFGRRKPWVVAGAPFLMISTWFLCNPRPGAGFLYLAVWAALFYSAFTAVKIPHLSWGTELATDYVERSRVTTFRETFTMLGSLLFVSAPLVLLKRDAPLHDVLQLISLTVLLTVPITATALGLWVPDPPPGARLRSNVFEELAAVLRNKILVRFVIARFFWAVEEGVANSLLVFSFTVGLSLPDKFFWAVFILYVSALVTLPLTLRLARHVEKHWLLTAGVAIQAVVYATVVALPQGNFMLVAILWIIIGIANTAMLSLPTSILADIIDWSEVQSGNRLSGAYVAIDNLIYKIGMAIGVGLAFGFLALLHFDPGATEHTALDVRNIRLLGFGLPCLFSAAAAVLYAGHPITRRIQQQLREEIARRQELGVRQIEPAQSHRQPGFSD